MAWNSDTETLVRTFERLVDATQRLVRENIRLARVELEREAHVWGRRSVWFLGALFLGFTGYGLLCALGTWALSHLLGLGAALATVAFANLMGGAFLFAVGMRKVRLQGRSAGVAAVPLTVEARGSASVRP